eukprot:TRINITY_DN1734_c0_g1_i5.p1 TRINITY_DN1734_c0_g1~~TRINITY_DN1734_c0_g1_i5.p1  ORF type:complete len:273 (+),score=34.86 TRINITY_DN1734_c0_g1_i5:107-925(+)
MASGMEHVCECSIRTCSGEQFIAEVQSSWNVKKLREYLCKHVGIPEYEQQFLRASVRLLSSDLVYPSTSDQPNDCDEITLVRASMPECFSDVELQKCWHLFLTFSRDHGDTVEGTFASHIARSACMGRILRAIRAESPITTTFSFVDLMSYFSQVNTKQSLPNVLAYEEDVVDEMLHDVGRTTCPRLPAAYRQVDRQADSSDDEGEGEVKRLGIYTRTQSSDTAAAHGKAAEHSRCTEIPSGARRLRKLKAAVATRTLSVARSARRYIGRFV